MILAIQQEADFQLLLPALLKAFPDHKVLYALFNKKVIRITKGSLQVLVGKQKDQQILCVGGLNMLHSKILIPFALGMTFLLVGGLLFLFLMNRSKKGQYTAMETEIADFLKNKFNA